MLKKHNVLNIIIKHSEKNTGLCLLLDTCIEIGLRPTYMNASFDMSKAYITLIIQYY